MRQVMLAAFALAPLISANPAAAQVEAGELEHARANARAGGPVSERDAELLHRWGCTSGTASPACGPNYTRQYRPQAHRRTRRHY
jgi:hypothetical protein